MAGKKLTEMEKREKRFIRDLSNKLKKLGYTKFSIEKIKKQSDKELYDIKKNEEIYLLILEDLGLFIYCDDFEPVYDYYLGFYRNDKLIAQISKKSKVDTLEKTIKTQHIKANYDKKNLEGYKTKIRQLLEVDKKIKITEIAKELGITRQAIYKNKELLSFIKSLKGEK
jgi:DNA-binding phage protein